VASRMLGQMPPAIGHFVGARGLQGGAWTALRMSSLIERRRQAVLDLFSLADRIVALTPWVRDLLKTNGVPDNKIVVAPHGISGSPSRNRAIRRAAGRIRIAHLGRLDPVKGTALLIRALAKVPDAPIDLDIFGIVQGPSDARVQTKLHQLAEDD